MQYTFSPVRYGFEWTKDWYTMDYDAAKKKAMAARTKKAKELKAKGYNVRKFTLSNQRLTMGGIGTGHPEITIVCSVYMLNAD